MDLDLDRQMFPFATPAQIDTHVRRPSRSWVHQGVGLAQGRDREDVPLDNIAAIFDALEQGFLLGDRCRRLERGRDCRRSWRVARYSERRDTDDIKRVATVV